MLAERLVKAAGQLEGEAVGDPLVVAGLQDRLGGRCSVWAIRGKRFRCWTGPAKPTNPCLEMTTPTPSIA